MRLRWPGIFCLRTGVPLNGTRAEGNVTKLAIELQRVKT